MASAKHFALSRCVAYLARHNSSFAVSCNRCQNSTSCGCQRKSSARFSACAVTSAKVVTILILDSFTFDVVCVLGRQQPSVSFLAGRTPHALRVNLSVFMGGRWACRSASFAAAIATPTLCVPAYRSVCPFQTAPVGLLSPSHRSGMCCPCAGRHLGS